VSGGALELLLATRSADKLRELRPIFAAAGLDVIDLDAAGIEEQTAEEGTLEVFESFEENALAKARYFFARGGGRPVVADDSGLEVLALGGRPGVRSKRWSGHAELSGRALDDANNRHLLQALEGERDRRARYVCVAAYVDGRSEWSCRGETSGVILDVPRGTGGFGYDPLFASDDLGGATFAEVDGAAKGRVSHRGRAFARLVASLERGR
jgi:XTP/dITP diphosphohydrolase